MSEPYRPGGRHLTRLATFPMPFGWEIRRFGGLVLSRSPMGFPSMALARSAGEESLTALVAR